MKRIAILFMSCLLCGSLFAQTDSTVKDSFYLMTPVEVRAIRAGDNAPFTKTNLSKKEIAKNNLGQDIPFILDQTPSVVINSDAGNGIGYTGIRIRGTDASRINVTLNGIPYNDAESQGTFFVDLPDFTSSTGSIQIQRGVGTSSNGAGAFGASINFSSNEMNKCPYAELNNSYGSFNSYKTTLKGGIGLVDCHFTIDVRLSATGSQGFIDRASSRMSSLYVSPAYFGEKNSLRLNVFTGKEETYQAWYGISEADLRAGRRTINYAGTEKPGEPYENEKDNYTQTHYQLFFDQLIGKKFSFNTALFITNGEGYYEQYKADQVYADYHLPDPIPGLTSDMVRRLWLNNDFYGSISSLQFKNKKNQATLGGGFTKYRGLHYGKVIWAASGFGTATNIGKYYDLGALKTDLNIYFKHQWEFKQYWFLFYDLQYRHVNYDINGFRNNPSLIINNDFDFFNPKAGISYAKNGWKSYLSFSVANKEPNRDDFEAGTTRQPKPERLYDTELGIEQAKNNYSWSATLYYMNYKDQLVLTGQINDVGAYTRTNIPKSYRAGIELQGNYKFNSWMNASANLALSKNKVQNFTEYIDDYDNGGQKINNYSSTDIALSPNIVGGATINFLPIKNLELSLLNKYVSKQYLDNTQDNSRVLDAFFVQDLRVIYTINKKLPKEINIIARVNNILNTKYEPNGYTYNYIYGGELSVNNYYFPMAGTNFMIGVNMKL
ncbi:MAG TPA: TonB-dependent receptor [Chitinophagaceae bacterium]|nr:TonB-dependent receptor [Chitinophagaceae bacterium]